MGLQRAHCCGHLEHRDAIVGEAIWEEWNHPRRLSDLVGYSNPLPPIPRRYNSLSLMVDMSHWAMRKWTGLRYGIRVLSTTDADNSRPTSWYG